MPIHILGALVLLVNLFGPMAQIEAASAAPAPLPDRFMERAQPRPNTPPPFPVPTQVVAIGTFQGALGCADYDPNCGATQLTENRGIWSGSFPIPPGSYSFRIAALSDQVRSLGQNGDPNGGDLSLDVPGDATGAYFEYNPRTGEIIAEAYAARVTLSGDFGTIDMRPSGGGFEAYVSLQPGAYNYQVLADDQPLGEPQQISVDNATRVLFQVDGGGSVSTQQVDQAGLTVTKTDEGGAPLTGSCFSLYDGDDLGTQACDSDDGEDGSTFLLFQNGVDPGTYELVETFTPDGQPQADSQDVQINTGSFDSLTVTAGGGEDTGDEGDEGDEPEDEETPVDDGEDEPPVDTGATIFIFAVDANDQNLLLPGACFEADGGAEACDSDDGADDGQTSLSVEPGSVTVTETEAPDTYENAGSFTLDAFDGGQYALPHTPSQDDQGDEEDVEEPTEDVADPGLGSLEIESRDENGNLIPGGCFAGVNEIGPYGPKCDDDGDGVVEFTDLGPGEQTITETEPAPGFEEASDPEQTVTVSADESETVTFDYAAAGDEDEPEDEETPDGDGGGPGTLTILAQDENGNPLGGGCYSVENGSGSFGPFCDEEDDGQIQLTQVFPGENTVTEDSPPPGAGDVDDDTKSVDVGSGQDEEIVFVYTVAEDEEEPTPTDEPEDEETPEGDEGGPGTLTILAQDDNGNPVGGGCYTVENESGSYGPFCDQENDGQVQLTQVFPGENTVTEDSAPPDAGDVDDDSKSVDVGSGEDEEITFVYAAEGDGDDQQDGGDQPEGEGAALRYVRTDNEGNPLGGACIRLEGFEFRDVCDNGNGDGDPTEGVILVENLEPSDYLVTEFQSPEGTEAPAPSFATVTEGQTEEFQASSDAPEEDVDEPEPEPTPTEVPTGDVVVLLQQEDGTPLGGGCFELIDNDGNSVAGEVCDEDGDAADDGRTGFLGVAAGSYTLRQTETPDGFETADDQPVDVVAEGVQVPVVNEATPPETGTLLITRRNDDNQRVPGACFTVTAQDGTVTGPVCDNGEGDANDSDGRVRIANLVVGDVTVTETTSPEGLTTPDPQTTTIQSSETAQLTFESGPSRGRVTVEFRDEDGNPVNGGCAQLTDAANSSLSFCDADDGAEDGQIVLVDFFPGPYTVTATPPASYETPEPQNIEIVAGETETVTFALTLAIGSLEITTVDEGNQVLDGACYTIAGPTNAGEVCDNGNGDDAGEGGLVRVLNLLAGDYAVTQSTAPEGYDQAADQTASVVADQTATLTFTNAESGGTVEIVKTDENDAPLGGSCFELQGAENYGPVCDNQEGDADDDPGVIRFESVAEGDYTVVETTTPEGYETAENGSVTVTEGEVSTVTVQNLLPPGAVQFVKTDENGDPLGGACFALTGGQGFGPVCDNEEGDGDDAEGTILIGDVPAGDYGWSETQAPEGYEQAEDGTVSVVSGETATVEVQNELAPPAFGAVEVVKTDENGDPLAESCFSLTGAQNYGPICDNDGNDTNDEEGTLGFADVTPGDYQAVETSTPDGYQTAADTPVTVTAGETATVEVENEPVPVENGAVEITKTDENDELLGGSCFGLTGPTEVAPVCDNGEGDGAGETGVILIEEVVAGEYTVTESTVPTGYQAAAPTTVTVAEGETAELTVQNLLVPPAVGSLTVLAQGVDSAPVSDACYSVTGGGFSAEICDNAGNDPDNVIGSIGFDGVPAVEVTVTETTPPTGYNPADPATQTTTVVADTQTDVTFAHTPLDDTGETGSIEIQLQSQDGETATTDECFVLRSGTEELGPYCDNGEGDGGDETGSILVEDVPTGSWSVVQPAAESTELRAAAVSEGAGLAAAGKSVTVQANVTVIVIIIIIIIEPEDGDLLIRKEDENGNLLAGACFTLTPLDGGDEIVLCDGDPEDGSGAGGLIRFNDIPGGGFELSESTPPPGYEQAANQNVEIEAGQTLQLTVENQPLEETGELVVTKTDTEDNPLEGACWRLYRANGQAQTPQVCDDDDGDSDGVTTFSDLPAGTYSLRETVAPEGYDLAPNRLVQIVAGQPTELSVEDSLQPGTIVVEKRREGPNGNLLVGACFRLDGDSNYDEICDSDDGLNDGRTRFLGVIPGDYDVIETVTPPGYETADPETVTAIAGQSVTIVIIDIELPEPEETGRLVIHKVDQNGHALPGACFTLRQGATTAVGQVCDEDDGDYDGDVIFEEVGVGTYQTHETRKPSADYQGVAPVEVEIEENETTEIEIANELRLGRIVIVKTNKQGHPLANACFDVAPDGKGPKCTDASGQVTFQGLQPGTYSVTETQAPPGYLPTAPYNHVVVKPGVTTVIDVVDKKAPQPDTGSVRVIKFYCTLGKGDEFTQIFDSSDPGAQQLTKTAGCANGVATFDIRRVGGEGGPGQIQTGQNGTYQTNLAPGTYRLAELSPDLPGPAQEDFQVYVGQQTTIVVINWVKPPPPAPVGISMIKYTCDPGYAGTYYADFLANCGDPSQLTNGVTFRISGQATGKAITGDGGQKGVTGFGKLPAGTYTIKEEIPYYTTAYIFCGLDVNNPTLKAVNQPISVKLTPGQQLTCVAFNVPPQVTKTTGSILIHKLNCPILNPPAGYNFEANCKPQTFSVQFSLSIYNGETRDFEPKTTGGTNSDGLLRFDNLTPGTYELKEVGKDWCFAESTSVNSQGNIIVKANQLAEVWIYNCNPTKNPPNTGAGPMAGVSGGAGGIGSMGGIALGLVWPLAAGLGFRLRRRRAA